MIRLAPSSLPDGRTGQLLALGLSVAVLAFVALGIIAPALHWYEARQELLAMRRGEAAHILAMQRLLPVLRQQAVRLGENSSGQLLLGGDSDAIAGANLQSALEGLASQAGTSLTSTAMLPARQLGALRQIGVEVNVTATWPVLTALFASIDAARPRMIVEDVSISSLEQTDTHLEAMLQASFSVAAFRAGRAP